MTTLELPQRDLQELLSILRTHVPQAEIWAYGSRVSGRAHEASDLDLVLRNPANPAIPMTGLPALREALSESRLPILVDVQDWARIPATFRREIEQAHVVLIGQPDEAG
ncbi:MAG: nucleotidyltransferase domain-containing protein [Sulfuricellaceae bacterium]